MGGMGMFWAVLLFIIAIVAIVLAGVALGRTSGGTLTGETLKNPKLVNAVASGSAPTVSQPGGQGALTVAGTNGAGLVTAASLAVATFTVTVTFSGTGYATAPNAVVLTAGSTNVTGVQLTSFNSKSFTASVTVGTLSASSVAVFSYMVM
jgi:hypothetical protein